MSQNVDDPVAGRPPADPIAGPDTSVVSSPAYDPAYVSQLEAYYHHTNPILEQYKDDFVAIVEDEGYREFQRKSRESYYDMQKRLEAEKEADIPDSEKRLLQALDERLGKFKPVLDDYEHRAQAQTRAAEEAAQDFARKETEFANRLVAEEKATPKQIEYLAKTAMALHKESVEAGAPRFVGIEEVWKDLYGPLEAKMAAKPVAKSLRAVSGATGVPGASRTIDDRSDLSTPGGLARYVLGVRNNQKKTG